VVSHPHRQFPSPHPSHLTSPFWPGAHPQHRHLFVVSHSVRWSSHSRLWEEQNRGLPFSGWHKISFSHSRYASGNNLFSIYHVPARFCGAHHRLIIEYHTLARSHGGSRARKIGEDEKGLSTHFLALGSDDVDDFAIGSEESIKLGL